MKKNWWQDSAQHGWQQSWQQSRQVESQKSWQDEWGADPETWSANEDKSWKTHHEWQEDGWQHWEQPKEEQSYPESYPFPSCAGRYNYDKPFSSEEWACDQEDLRQQWEEAEDKDLPPVPLGSRPWSYHAPSSSEHWAEDPYHWEKASTPVEVIDDDDPERLADEEAAKLHKQFMEYQEDQEEEVKHYTKYVEKKDQEMGTHEAGFSSKESHSIRKETTSTVRIKKHTEKEDFEFEAEKSGWFNHCTVLIALWQMNRVAKMQDVMRMLADHPLQKTRVMMLKSHIQKYGDSGPKRLGYKR